MPLFMIEGSKDGSLFSEAITASNMDDAERAAVIRLCEAWGEEGDELSDLGDAASVYEFGPSDYARNAADEMLAVLKLALPHISSEVEQRKCSGNDEYFADLEEVERQMGAAIAMAEGAPFMSSPIPSVNEVKADIAPSTKVAAPPELPAGATFNEAGLETAMCLWEAILEIRDRPDIAIRFDEVGTVVMRHAVMTLIPDCEREWHEGEDRGEDNSPYDWEWCPAFLERNLWKLGVEPQSQVDAHASDCDELEPIDTAPHGLED